MSQALTVTMTKLGVNIAVTRAVPLSSATGSVDFVTINHGLGKTPHMVNTTLRSVVAVGTSGGAPGLVVDSYDQTKIIVRLPLDSAASTSVQFDCYAIFAHSIVQ